jgi:hypothetical protein
MPFKANAARRHHIPKQKRKVTNWAAYDASLRQHASLTVWFSDDAIAGWKAEPRTTRRLVEDTPQNHSPVWQAQVLADVRRYSAGLRLTAIAGLACPHAFARARVRL